MWKNSQWKKNCESDHLQLLYNSLICLSVCVFVFVDFDPNLIFQSFFGGVPGGFGFQQAGFPGGSHGFPGGSHFTFQFG